MQLTTVVACKDLARKWYKRGQIYLLLGQDRVWGPPKMQCNAENRPSKRRLDESLAKFLVAL